MSGEGVMATGLPEFHRYPDERRDVLAYLERKRENALTMAGRSAEFADEGNWCARMCQIMIDDITGGLHMGCADVAADLAAGEMA